MRGASKKKNQGKNLHPTRTKRRDATTWGEEGERKVMLEAGVLEAAGKILLSRSGGEKKTPQF